MKDLMFAISEIKMNAYMEQVESFCDEPDYEAAVREYYDAIDEPVIKAVQSPELIEYVQAHLKSLSDKDLELAALYDKPEIVKRLIASFIRKNFKDCKGHPNTGEIAKLLKGFPDEVIRNVCNVIMPVNLEALWGESNYMAKKLKIAREARKELNTSIKYLAHQVKACEESKYFPLIVLKPLREAYAMATAYRDLLDIELKRSRYKADGIEYKNQTSRDVWNGIIVDVVNIMKPALKRYGDEGEQYNYYSYTAKLLAITYPWCWAKNHHKATKTVRERYERLT